MLKIKVDEEGVSIHQNGSGAELMRDFLRAMLGVYQNWNDTDEQLGEHFKRMVAAAANPKAGFWDIKTEKESGARVTVCIPRPRKGGESCGS